MIEQVISTINKDAELYKDVKFGKMGAREYNEDTVKKTCLEYARKHNDRFGKLQKSELKNVDWSEVIRRV